MTQTQLVLLGTGKGKGTKYLGKTWRLGKATFQHGPLEGLSGGPPG